MIFSPWYLTTHVIRPIGYKLLLLYSLLVYWRHYYIISIVLIDIDQCENDKNTGERYECLIVELIPIMYLKVRKSTLHDNHLSI